MNKTYLVRRILVSSLGGAIVVPVRGFDNEGAAHDFKRACEGETKSFFALPVAMGPGSTAALGAVLNQFGIEGMSYDVLTVDVHSSHLITPAFVIPSSN